MSLTIAEVWYFISITDQIRDLLLGIAYTVVLAIVLRYMQNRKAETKRGFFLLFLVLSTCLTLRALVPNVKLAREIIAIKYGQDMQNRRIQDKVYNYELKTFKGENK